MIVAKQRQAIRAAINKSMDSIKKRPLCISANTPSGGHQRTVTSLNSARCQILRSGPELLRFSENGKPKTRSTAAVCVSHIEPAAVTQTGFLNKCRDPWIDELRLEWLSSPQAYSAHPRSLLRAFRPHPRSQSLCVMSIVSVGHQTRPGQARLQ